MIPNRIPDINPIFLQLQSKYQAIDQETESQNDRKRNRILTRSNGLRNRRLVVYLHGMGQVWRIRAHSSYLGRAERERDRNGSFRIDAVFN